MNKIDKEKFQWFKCQSNNSRLLEWQKMAGLSSDGDLFVPAVVAGEEKQVVLCATWDGEPLLLYSDHAFVRADWIMQNYDDPKIRESLTRLKQKLVALNG